MSGTSDHLGRPVVAVTGIGMVTSLGVGKKESWEALTSGRSGIHAIGRFPTQHLNTKIAGTIEFLKSSEKGATALTYELAETAALEAIGESTLNDRDFGGPLFLAAPPVELGWKRRVQLYSSTSEAEGYCRLLAAASGQNVREALDEALFGTVGGWLSERLGTRGVPITLSTACASGATAIQLGVEAIRRGECDRALAIGADG